MSRRIIQIDEDRYAVVGWDNPLQSYFWQVWHATDELRMNELERTGEENAELAALYAKYDEHGGEPLIADSCLGDPRKVIRDVVQLQQQIRDYVVIPADVARELVEDKDLGR